MATQAIQPRKTLEGFEQPDCIFEGNIIQVHTPDEKRQHNYWGFIKTDTNDNVYFHWTGVNGKRKPTIGDFVRFYRLRSKREVDRAVSIDIVR